MTVRAAHDGERSGHRERVVHVEVHRHRVVVEARAGAADAAHERAACLGGRRLRERGNHALAHDDPVTGAQIERGHGGGKRRTGRQEVAGEHAVGIGDHAGIARDRRTGARGTLRTHRTCGALRSRRTRDTLRSDVAREALRSLGTDGADRASGALRAGRTGYAGDALRARIALCSLESGRAHRAHRTDRTGDAVGALRTHGADVALGTDSSHRACGALGAGGAGGTAEVAAVAVGAGGERQERLVTVAEAVGDDGAHLAVAPVDANTHGAGARGARAHGDRDGGQPGEHALQIRSPH